MGASGQQKPNNSGDTSNEDYTILYRRHLLVELRPPLHMNYLRLISSEINRLHKIQLNFNYLQFTLGDG
jgi:hypothetical protein